MLSPDFYQFIYTKKVNGLITSVKDVYAAMLSYVMNIGFFQRAIKGTGKYCKTDLSKVLLVPDGSRLHNVLI